MPDLWPVQSFQCPHASIPEPIAVPRYRIEALEKFVVRTVYEVTARSPKQAEKLYRSGRAAYENQTIEDGDEEWLKTVSVSEQRQALSKGTPSA